MFNDRTPWLLYFWGTATVLLSVAVALHGAAIQEELLTRYEGTVNEVAIGNFRLRTNNGGVELFPIGKRTKFYLDGIECRFDEVRIGQRVVAVWKGSPEGYTVEVRIKTR